MKYLLESSYNFVHFINNLVLLSYNSIIIVLYLSCLSEVKLDITITKKIAKQGKNLVLIIPKDLHNFLKQGDLVKVNIGKMEDGQ